MVRVSKVLGLGLVWDQDWGQGKITVRGVIMVRVSETIMVNTTQTHIHNPNPPNQELGGSWKLPLLGTSVENITLPGTSVKKLRVPPARLSSSLLFDTASSVDGRVSDAIDESLVLVSSLLRHIPNIVVTLGKHGVLLCRRGVSASSPFPVRGDRPVVVSTKSRAIEMCPVSQCPLLLYAIYHYEERVLYSMVVVVGIGHLAKFTKLKNL